MIIGISGKMHSGKDTLGMLIQALTMSHGGTRWKEDPVGYVKAYGAPNLKGGWEIRKFGYKLKQIASILTGIPAEKFEDQDFKDSYLGPEWDQPMFKLGEMEGSMTRMKVRTFLQLLGTEAMRFGLHKDTWTNALFADYGKCTKCGEKENLHYNRSFVGDQITYSDMLCNECGTLFNYPNWIITDLRFSADAKAVKDRGGIVIRINRSGLTEGTHESEVALDNYEGFDYVFDNNGTIEGLAERAKGLLMMLKNDHGYIG